MAQLHARGELALTRLRARVGDRHALHRPARGRDRGRRAPRGHPRDHRPRVDHRDGPVPARPERPVPGRVHALVPATWSVVGAGIVGAATALRARAVRGVEVDLLDAGEVSGGTTGLGEGNVLCSDKDAGPELDARGARPRRLRRDRGARYGERARIRRKGALVVHRDEAGLAAEPARLERLRAAGVACELLEPGQARALEPGARRAARRDLGPRRPPVRPARDRPRDGGGGAGARSTPARVDAIVPGVGVLIAAARRGRRGRPRRRPWSAELARSAGPPPAARAAQGPARPARAGRLDSATRSSTAATSPRSRPPRPSCRSRP